MRQAYRVRRVRTIRNANFSPPASWRHNISPSPAGTGNDSLRSTSVGRLDGCAATALQEHLITRPRLTGALIALLGFLAAIAPFSTDLYLPTFTTMAADLNITAGQVQLTLTGFLIGIGAGPLFVGPLSDRFGRRTILLIALAVFVAAALVMTLALNVWVLIPLRMIQGVAAAAGTVLSRAIVGDLAPRETAVRALSIIVFAVGTGAFIAAPLGATVGAVWGWRGALFTLAIIGALMFTLVALFVRESLPKQERHGHPDHTESVSGASSTRRGGSITALLTALRSPKVPAYALILGATYASMMSWIASSPFVARVVLDLSIEQYAWSFAAATTAMLVASTLNAWLGVRVGPRRMLAFGQTVAIVAAITLLVLTLSGALTAPAFFILGFGLITGLGITMANTMALALAAAGTARGSASALLSTAQYTTAAIATPFVGLLGPATAVPMAITIVMCSTVAVTTTAFTLSRKRASAAAAATN